MADDPLDTPANTGIAALRQPSQQASGNVGVLRDENSLKMEGVLQFLQRVSIVPRRAFQQRSKLPRAREMKRS